MSNHVDRFFAAVTVLAGDGHIKQRLIKAYEDHLADICEDELPPLARQPFADLRAEMYRVTPHNGEGPICASVRKMSAHEACQCASSVVTLFNELLRATGSGQPSLAMPAEDGDTIVPPFLVKTVN